MHDDSVEHILRNGNGPLTVCYIIGYVVLTLNACLRSFVPSLVHDDGGSEMWLLAFVTHVSHIHPVCIYVHAAIVSL